MVCVTTEKLKLIPPSSKYYVQFIKDEMPLETLSSYSDILWNIEHHCTGLIYYYGYDGDKLRFEKKFIHKAIEILTLEEMQEKYPEGLI